MQRKYSSWIILEGELESKFSLTKIFAILLENFLRCTVNVICSNMSFVLKFHVGLCYQSMRPRDLHRNLLMESS